MNKFYSWLAAERGKSDKVAAKQGKPDIIGKSYFGTI